MKKYILMILPVLALLTACKSKPKPVAKQPFTLTDSMMASTQISSANEQPVQSQLKLYGLVSADNNKMSQVYPVVGGNVIKVNAELGDYVKQGTILAVMRSSEVAGYENERLDAESDLALDEKKLQVAKDMYDAKLNSQEDVVAADKELQKSKANLARINEVYQIYNLKGGAIYNVTAPISGFIINKNVTQNELLNNDNVSSLFSIAQINEVWVLANVNESDISVTKEGMEANIKTLSYPDRVFKGKVDKIFNILDPDTKTLKIRIQIQNEDLALKPGMSATVTLNFQQPRNMIAIPSSSIIFDDNRNWVLAYKNKSHIEPREVEVYNQLGDTTYIATGIQPGEKVITKNQLQIYDALTGNE